MPGANGQLKAIVERIERVEGEIKELNADKSDIYAEAKSSGFDVRALKTVIGIRRKDPNQAAEHDALVETYMASLGTLPAINSTGARRRERPRPEQFQPPRLAPLGEVKVAYRAGTPIQNDVAYQGAKVYFAECKKTKRLKIGISNDVTSRLEHLRQGSGLELKLIATLEGNRQEELRALEAFSEWRTEGEWHGLTAECRAKLREYLDAEATRARVHEAAPAEERSPPIRKVSAAPSAEDDLAIPPFLKREREPA